MRRAFFRNLAIKMQKQGEKIPINVINTKREWHFSKKVIKRPFKMPIKPINSKRERSFEMLKDQLNIIKMEGSPRINREAACRYCGQIMTVETGTRWSEEDTEELVAELCDCDEAQCYAHKKRRKESAIKAIEGQFGKEGEEC